MIQAIDEGKLPTNEQLIQALFALRNADDMKTMHILLHPFNRKAWSALNALLEVFCLFIRDKNPDETFQQLLHDYRIAKEEELVTIDWPKLALLFLLHSKFRSLVWDMNRLVQDAFSLVSASPLESNGDQENSSSDTLKPIGSKGNGLGQEAKVQANLEKSMGIEAKKTKGKEPMTSMDPSKSQESLYSTIHIEGSEVDLCIMALTDEHRTVLAQRAVSLLQVIRQSTTLSKMFRQMTLSFKDVMETIHEAEAEAHPHLDKVKESFKSFFQNVQGKSVEMFQAYIGTFHQHILRDPKLCLLAKDWANFLVKCHELDYVEHEDCPLQLSFLILQARMHLLKCYPEDTTGLLKELNALCDGLVHDPLSLKLIAALKRVKSFIVSPKYMG